LEVQVIVVTPEIAIDERELSEQFVRSTGPGGQNVNKVSTAVQLRFDAGRSPTLLPDVRERLLHLAGHLATDDGVIVVIAQRFRTQERNRVDARERLVSLIRAAAEPPVPRTATRPTRASKRHRLEAKRQRGATKANRQRPGSGDDGG